MTNEEAIKRLKSDIYKYSDFTENPNENEFWTAFDMAVKSLEQEPCEDAISRQAVLDGLASIAKAKAKSDKQKALMGRVMFFTEQLPPVTPQPKIGKWVRVTDKTGHLVWECDRCGWQQRFTTNYCPDCGAKMQEVEE